MVTQPFKYLSQASDSSVSQPNQSFFPSVLILHIISHTSTILIKFCQHSNQAPAIHTHMHIHTLNTIHSQVLSGVVYQSLSFTICMLLLLLACVILYM